jgi:sugar phosphate permease
MLTTWLMLAFNWRWMFVVVGVVGLIAAAIWTLLYRDPDSVGLSAEEHAYLANGTAQGTPSKPTFGEWRSLFAYRTTWGMILGFFGSVYLNWVYLTWLPGYLEIERHMSTFGTGFAASLGAVQNFGGFLGGALAPIVTGAIAQATRSFVPALLTGAVIAFVSAMIYVFVVRDPIPQEAGGAERRAP